MKIRLYLVLFILTLFSLTDVHSQNPEYTLTAKNFNRQAADSLTFEVYLHHTNSGSVNQFQYAAGQYFFLFNPAIANGGTLTYKIIGSGLPQNQQPRKKRLSFLKK